MTSCFRLLSRVRLPSTIVTIMPAVRTDKENAARGAKPTNSKKSKNHSGPPMFPVGEKTEDLADCLFFYSMFIYLFPSDGSVGKVEYPLNSSERVSFRTKDGKVSYNGFHIFSQSQPHFHAACNAPPMGSIRLRPHDPTRKSHNLQRHRHCPKRRVPALRWGCAEEQPLRAVRALSSDSCE